MVLEKPYEVVYNSWIFVKKNFSLKTGKMNQKWAKNMVF